jgi:hypothetical protein
LVALAGTLMRTGKRNGPSNGWNETKGRNTK